MRFAQHTILELSLVIRDTKSNPQGYDKEARDLLRRACRMRLSERTSEEFLGNFTFSADFNLAKQAWSDVQAYVKAGGYTSGVWSP